MCDARLVDHSTTPAMRPLLSAAVAVLLLSGCISLDQVYREIERLPRQWDPRVLGGVDARLQRDVQDYVREMDRDVRLDSRQRGQIENLLTSRAARISSRDYPFPRERATSRTAEDWWVETDRQIERQLDSRQRDAYRDFVYRIEDRRYEDRYDDRYEDDWRN